MLPEQLSWFLEAGLPSLHFKDLSIGKPSQCKKGVQNRLTEGERMTTSLLPRAELSRLSLTTEINDFNDT